MMLNETTQKIDTMLEIVCKKFEKVAFEHSPDPSAPMPFKVDPDRPPSKCSDIERYICYLNDILV